MSRPILIVSDVAARLLRRGLIDPTDPTLPRWRQSRVLVFADRPVVYELPRVVREPAAEKNGRSR